MEYFIIIGLAALCVCTMWDNAVRLRDKDEIVRDLNDVLLRQNRKIVRYRVEINRLNINQKGYRHPISGKFVSSDIYYSAVEGL